MENRPDISMQARLDQISANLRDHATLTYDYYRHLTSTGFSEQQAMAFVLVMQQAFWANLWGNGNPPK